MFTRPATRQSLDVAYGQLCWAHLKRDFQGAGRPGRGGYAGRNGRAAACARALRRLARFPGRGARPRRGPVRHAAGTGRLRAPAGAGVACRGPKAAGLCRALDRLWPAHNGAALDIVAVEEWIHAQVAPVGPIETLHVRPWGRLTSQVGKLYDA
jgi:hypothetical protein